MISSLPPFLKTARQLATVIALVACPLGCAPVEDIVAERKLIQTSDGEVTRPDSRVDDARADTGKNDAATQTPTSLEPSIRAGDNHWTSGFCSPGVAKKPAFLNALCVCTDYPISVAPAGGAFLTTNAINSATGDISQPSAGGSVGINGYLSINSARGSMDIGGSLVVSGTNGIVLNSANKLTVTENLEIADALVGPPDASVVVKKNARVGGKVNIGALSVDGTLTTPSGKEFNLGAPQVNGSREYADVTVSPPCGCAADELLDISKLVDSHSGASNDNARLSFDISRFSNYASDATLPLPEGSFYMGNGITVNGNLTIEVSGRARLYVRGQVNVQGSVHVSLKPDTDIDLIISNGLVVKSNLDSEPKSAAGRVRFFILGDVNLSGTGSSTFAGSLYAPSSALTLLGPTEVLGSVFIGRVDTVEQLTIHYDQNPIQSHRECE